MCFGERKGKREHEWVSDGEPQKEMETERGSSKGDGGFSNSNDIESVQA